MTENDIRHMAYKVFQERLRMGDPDAWNEKENWALAKKLLEVKELEKVWNTKRG